MTMLHLELMAGTQTEDFDADFFLHSLTLHFNCQKKRTHIELTECYKQCTCSLNQSARKLVFYCVNLTSTTEHNLN